jgi:hypothetical protein
MTQRIRGVLSPVLTPFKADLSPRKSFADAAERGMCGGTDYDYEQE